MSFREVRNLVEQLRVLGFPRLVSVENFSTPNFPLVSEMLMWTAGIVDSEHRFPSSIDSEEDRVLLIRLATVFFHQRLGIQLNPVRLYGSDRWAAQQLLKITNHLHQATLTVLPAPHMHQAQGLDITQVTVKDLRETRQLASTIIMDAACFTDRLTLEVDNKMCRVKAERQGLDMERMEATTVAALHAVAASLTHLQDATQALHISLQEVEEKMEKKKELLTRNKKRLDALHKIKPSWQCEFEGEENELRDAWDGYITRHRTLAYLEDQLDTLHSQHLEATRRAVEGQEEPDSPQPRVNEMVRLLCGLSVESSGELEWSDSAVEDSDSSLTLESPSHIPAPVLDPTNTNTSDMLTTGQPQRVSVLPPSGPFVPPSPSVCPAKPNKTSTTCSTSKSSSQVYTDLPRPAMNTLTRSAPTHPLPARPMAARPKSSHWESRNSSLGLTASGRVSPLSASDDDLIEHF